MYSDIIKNASFVSIYTTVVYLYIFTGICIYLPVREISLFSAFYSNNTTSEYGSGVVVLRFFLGQL